MGKMILTDQIYKLKYTKYEKYLLFRACLEQSFSLFQDKCRIIENFCQLHMVRFEENRLMPELFQL